MSITLMIASIVRPTFILSIVTVGLIATACGGGNGADKWVLGSSTFLPRHSFSSAVFDGQFYVMGGWAGDGNTDTVEVWVPDTLLWAKKPHMPRLLSDSSASVVGNIAIATGGRVGNTERDEHVTDEAWSFSPISGSWTPLQPMPGRRENHVQAVVDGTLIVVGGENHDGPVLETWLYEIASQTWSVGRPLPQPRIEAAMTLWNGKVYLFGGRDDEPLQDILAYDVNSDSWAVAGLMPDARYGLGVVNARDGIHVLGGQGVTVSNRHDIFDPEAGTWKSAPELISARSHFGIGLIGDTIVIAGGAVNPRDVNETVFSQTDRLELSSD
jgi:hypothetical protein